MRKRRSKIKKISIFFIVIAVIIVIQIVVPVLLSNKFSLINIKKDNIGKNAFSNLSYKTYDNNGKEIILTSDKVYEKGKDKYDFKNVKISFEISNLETGKISANIGRATISDRKVCDFIGNVNFTTTTGMRIKSEKSNVDFDKEMAKGNTRISIEKNTTKFFGDSYKFDFKNDVLTLIGNASGFSENPKRKIASEKIVVEFSGDDIRKMDAEGNSSFLSTDYDLYSKNIVYSTEKIYAESNVRLLYKRDGKNLDLTANKMKAILNEKSSEIQEVFADGDIVMKVKNNIIRSEKAVYKNNKIIATGNVVISNSKGDVFGDIAEFDIDTENVVVRKSSGIVKNKGTKKQ